MSSFGHPRILYLATLALLTALRQAGGLGLHATGLFAAHLRRVAKAPRLGVAAVLRSDLPFGRMALTRIRFCNSARGARATCKVKWGPCQTLVAPLSHHTLYGSLRHCMTRVVLLGRVSRGERTQDPEGQLQALRGAASRHGWEVAEELSLTCSAWDEAQAGKVWAAAVEALHQTGAEVLAVWAVDRLARGGIEDVFGKVRHLEHLGVQLWSAQEPFLSSTDRQSRELLLALAAWVAKWESQRKSERLKAKAALKRTRAGNGGGRGRWGRGSMPTPEDAALVASLRAQGRSLRAIAAEVGLSRGTVHALAQGTHPQTAEPAATCGRSGQRGRSDEGGAVAQSVHPQADGHGVGLHVPEGAGQWQDSDSQTSKAPAA